MGILRSECMRSGTLLLPIERARQLVDTVGRTVTMEFTDMHASKVAPNRPYKRFVWRIEEMERILRFLVEQLIIEEDIEKNHVAEFLEYDHYYKMETVEAELSRSYQTFIRFQENNASLLKARNAAIEERYLVEYAASYFWQRNTIANSAPTVMGRSSRSDETPLMDRSVSVFSHVAGVLPLHDQERFARFLFRSTRGNTFTHFEPINLPLVDPDTGRECQKVIFVVYYQDARLAEGHGSAMHDRIIRACTQYGVNIYPWVTSHAEAVRKLQDLGQALIEKDRALDGYERFVQENRTRLLEVQLSGNSLIEDWRLFCLKEKSIYYTLNHFEGESTIRCDCWYPLSEEEAIQGVLLQNSTAGGLEDVSAMLVTDRISRPDAPTYFETNEFVAATQELIHTYGIPRYKEVTPVFFSTVTFPFIFGVMFGDVGHGTLLTLAGIYLIRNAEDLRYSQPSLFTFRYMIFMMGFFATFAGFMYNDFFATPLNLFGSRYAPLAPTLQVGELEPLFDPYNGATPPSNVIIPPTYQHAGPYPFGIDPAWVTASNGLLFLNSFKMKFAVIFGVFQMIMGLCLRVVNAFGERSVLDVFAECLPMFMFMLCFFCYMDYMICYKWVTHLPDPPGAPSIINNIIAMAMFDKLATTSDGPGGPQVDIQLFPGEKDTQNRMMYYIMASVPMLCLIKPCFRMFQEYRLSRSPGYDRIGIDPERDPQAKGKARVDIGEVWIHQIIESIEYLLGTVSHTASYLRLWALSLAHQQLSLVFFSMTIRSSMQSSFPSNAVSIFISFAVWAAITAGVLMGMDTLECFLHTLRLHWVEFQSKFYRGDGVLFKPYSHQRVLNPVAE